MKRTEQFVTVARGKNRAALHLPRELLKFSIGDVKARGRRDRGAEPGPVMVGRHTLVDEVEADNVIRRRFTVA